MTKKKSKFANVGEFFPYVPLTDEDLEIETLTELSHGLRILARKAFMDAQIDDCETVVHEADTLASIDLEIQKVIRSGSDAEKKAALHGYWMGFYMLMTTIRYCENEFTAGRNVRKGGNNQGAENHARAVEIGLTKENLLPLFIDEYKRNPNLPHVELAARVGSKLKPPRSASTLRRIIKVGDYKK